MTQVKLQIDGEFQKRRIGYYSTTSEGKKVFVTTRKPQHYFKKFNGYGFNKALINELISEKVDYIILQYRKFNDVSKRWFLHKTYVVDPSVVRDKGLPYQKPPFEPQLIINKSFLEEVE